MSAPVSAPTREKSDLLAALARHRAFLRTTLEGLTDEQAARRSTVSELCPGGVVKHVAQTERRWIRFILDGPAAMAMNEASFQEHLDGFRMTADDTVPGLLNFYAEVARETEAVVTALPDLD